MQLYVFRRAGRKLAKLLAAAYNVNMTAVLAYPNRQRSAPVTFAAESPVYNVFKEVAHAAVLYGLGQPVYALIVLDKLIAHGSHLYEPAFAGVIDERGIAAPAERIAVLKRYFRKQRAALLQILQYHRVGLLNEGACPRGILGHVAAGVHHLNKGYVVIAANAIVVLTEGRGVMDYARAVVRGNVIVRNYAEALLAGFRGGLCRAFKQRLVGAANKLAARKFTHYFCILAQHLFNKILGQYERFAVLFRAAVYYVGIYAQANV